MVIFIWQKIMSIKFINNNELLPPNYSALNPPNREGKLEVGGKKYTFIGTSHKNYTLGQRCWLIIRALFTTLRSLKVSEKAREDFWAFFAGKKVVEIYRAFPPAPAVILQPIVKEINYYDPALTKQIVQLNLPSLSQEEREATFGAGPFYSSWFNRHARDFHANGDTWAEDMHQKFFEEGLLNHYVKSNIEKIFGLDLSYNYEAWLTPEYEGIRFAPFDRNNFRMLAQKFNLNIDNLTDDQMILLVKPYAVKLKQLTIHLTQTEYLPIKLRKLGARFQREKVETEKLHNKLKGDNGQDIQNLMLKKDKDTELIQQLIFFWTVTLVEQVKKHLIDKPLDVMTAQGFSFKDPDFLSSLLT